MKIALLCPTRERIEKQIRLCESLKNTANDINSFILYFGVDKDDTQREQTYNLIKKYPFIKIIDIDNNGTFLGLGKIWNIMVSQIQDEILSMVGDDMVFETKNWDLMILEEFDNKHLPSDKFKLVHCNDGMRGPGNHYATMPPLAVNSFIHRIFYETFGYYVREEWKHGFHDTWLHTVFLGINRVSYRHDIMIRHLHYSNVSDFKEKRDKISENLDKEWENNNEMYPKYRAMENIRQAEINKMKSIIDSKKAEIKLW